jgi:hypothetical protein
MDLRKLILGCLLLVIALPARAEPPTRKIVLQLYGMR